MIAAMATPMATMPPVAISLMRTRSRPKRRRSRPGSMFGAVSALRPRRPRPVWVDARSPGVVAGVLGETPAVAGPAGLDSLGRSELAERGGSWSLALISPCYHPDDRPANGDPAGGDQA